MPDDPTHDAPLTASHHHQFAPLAADDRIDELDAPPGPRLRAPFGCFP